MRIWGSDVTSGMADPVPAGDGWGGGLGGQGQLCVGDSKAERQQQVSGPQTCTSLFLTFPNDWQMDGKIAWDNRDSGNDFKTVSKPAAPSLFSSAAGQNLTAFPGNAGADFP